MALPTEADVFGPGAGATSSATCSPRRSTARSAYASSGSAWDTCLSSFAGRQSLYEYFFFGDPVRMAGALVAGYDREPYKQRVREFLDQDR